MGREKGTDVNADPLNAFLKPIRPLTGLVIASPIMLHMPITRNRQDGSRPAGTDGQAANAGSTTFVATAPAGAGYHQSVQALEG